MNSLDGATDEDIRNLAEHLQREFSNTDLGDRTMEGLDVADENITVLSQTVSNCIGGLILLPFTKIGVEIPLTLTEQEDRALRKTQEALRGITDAKWEQLARLKKSSVLDIRKKTWEKIFLKYRNEE